MKQLFYAVIVGSLSIACKNDREANIYEEDLEGRNEKLSYCDTCLTKLDVYKYETERGNKPVHHILDPAQANFFFGNNLFFSSGDGRGWPNSMIFIQKESSGVTILHAYNANGSDEIISYAAAALMSNEIMADLPGEKANVPGDFLTLKSLYKNKKMELDRRLGKTRENIIRSSKYIPSTIRKDLRANQWSKPLPGRDPNSSHAESYSLRIDLLDSCYAIDKGYENTKDCYRSLNSNKLVVRFLDRFFELPRVKGYHVESMTLEERKNRSTFTGFDNYLARLKSQNQNYEEYMAKPDFRTKHHDSLYMNGADRRDYQEMIRGNYARLKTDDFEMPKGFIPTYSEILHQRNRNLQ